MSFPSTTMDKAMEALAVALAAGAVIRTNRNVSWLTLATDPTPRSVD